MLDKTSSRFGNTGRLNMKQSEISADLNEGRPLTFAMFQDSTIPLSKPLHASQEAVHSSAKVSGTSNSKAPSTQMGKRLRKPGLDLLSKAEQIEQRVIHEMRRKNNRSARFSYRMGSQSPNTRSRVDSVMTREDR